MIALLFWHKALLAIAPVIVLVVYYITKPANCPRCGQKHDDTHAAHRPDRATCSRCGTRYNPNTGKKL